MAALHGFYSDDEVKNWPCEITILPDVDPKYGWVLADLRVASPRGSFDMESVPQWDTNMQTGWHILPQPG